MISKRQSVPNLVSMFDRQKSTISEEDPYSIPGNNSSSSGSRSSGHYVSTGPMAPPNSNADRNGKSPPNGALPQQQSGQEQKPPKLPPRDFERKQKQSKQSSKKSKNPSKDVEVENNYGLGNNARHFGLMPPLLFWLSRLFETNDCVLCLCSFRWPLL